MSTEIMSWVLTTAAIWVSISLLMTLLVLLIFPIVMRLFLAFTGGTAAFAIGYAISMVTSPAQHLENGTLYIAIIASLAIGGGIFYLTRGITHPHDRNMR